MPKILQNHYVLAVHDLKKSSGFFVDYLDFEVVAEPPGWVFVEKDNCIIMLGKCPDDASPGELGSHSYFGYLLVDDADGYYESLKAKGVEPLSPISDKPWGMREFALKTPEGHRLTIGQTIAEPESQ
ncbi:MAG TPA: VOC family protein [Blastocatellia bacterium]|nr:VOC family protein [Blastocatellia bacterium]